MTVDRDYMLKKAAGPSRPKYFINTRIVPRLVNSAGSAEVLLDRTATVTGIRPSLILAGAVGTLSLVLFRMLRHQRILAKG